ncbi:MAG TPA: cation:proton antiporter [Thermoleophilaceae bacterium]|nr:cation:proton antiporter [Thermoleophilaceae bacterium]
MELEYTNLLIVAAVGFGAPLLLGFFPKARVPSVVLEIVAGILIGPAALGWVEVDAPVAVLSALGLAILLFLAGLEIEFTKLRGQVLRLAVIGFVVSVAIGIVVGFAFDAAGTVKDPLFLAIVLCSTSLGVLVPVLKDAGETTSRFGQLVIAACSIADFAAVILLSLFFSREAKSTTSQVLLLGGLVLVSLLVGLTIRGVEHSARIRSVLRMLQDTTAQIRVRGAFVLLIGLVALATDLGLEVILGAFIAGAILTLVDRDEMMTHPEFRLKLEAIGFGVFIPIFFVTTGVRYDLDALSDASTLAKIPLFLLALVAVRGLPALVYRGAITRSKMLVAAIMQSTSLPFIVAATAIGRDIGVITAANQAALIAAGLVSVLVFPALGLALLRREATSQPAKPPPVIPTTKEALP